MLSLVSSPFHVIELSAPAAGSATENRRFVIQAEVGAAAQTYCDLFQAFGFSGNAKSWSEHIQAIVEEEIPDLFDHLEFTTDDGLFRVYADSRAAADDFTSLLNPLFADLHKLRRYLSLLDSEDFFE